MSILALSKEDGMVKPITMRKELAMSPIVRTLVSVAICIFATGHFDRLGVREATAQIGSGGLRPFVIGVIPVRGRNGAVGGVSIDADGVLDRAAADETGRLRAARLDALQPIDSNLSRTSQLRKISLRQIEAAIAKHARNGTPLPEEVLYLGGLQRVRYVFVYPENGDVVLAGPAEGWKVNRLGDVVGVSTNRAVLQLDDLIVALRTAEAAASGHGISCSIDPSEEGLMRYQRLIGTGRLQMSAATIARLERSLGPSVISLTGVTPDTHFAHVLVGADFMMKRFAMGFEAAPVDGLPSYMRLLQSSTRTPRNAMFRLWLAPDYESVTRDAGGLAWELKGNGVKALTEDSLFKDGGQVVDTGVANPLAQQWADTFSAKFGELSTKVPVFAKLRNCIDLAVIAAIITKYDIAKHAGHAMPILLTEPKIQPAKYQVPQTTPSRASFVKRNRQYIVSISGGVDLDSWAVLDHVAVDKRLANSRVAAKAPQPQPWWWD